MNPEEWEIRRARQKPVHEFGFFRKQSELMIMLPQVSKLYEIFGMFAIFGKKAGVDGKGVASRISLSDLPDCLRAMGLNISDPWLDTVLEEHMSRRKALGVSGSKEGQRASFELVLSLYCTLAERSKEPTAEDMMRALRSLDQDNTGVLAYSELRRLLINMGERLDESEVFCLLHRASDANGNVHYEHLVHEMFGKDAMSEESQNQAKIYLQAVGRNAIDMDMAKRDEFIDALRRADPLNTGFIEPQRLLALVNRRKKRFTIAELEVLTEGMQDSNHSINYKSFMRSIMNE